LPQDPGAARHRSGVRARLRSTAADTPGMIGREHMNNLWTVSTPRAGGLLIHSFALSSRDFAPTAMRGQAIDRNGELGVLPLPGVSY
jgi:hypothetical protein